MNICKYELPLSGSYKLVLPYKSQILSVKNQHSRLVLYAIVNSKEKEMRIHNIVIALIGEAVDSGTHKFINTVMFSNGNYVVHVFEKLTI